MPSIYDSYQLANSSRVPSYVGSAVPEMTKVADVMQQRYDATELMNEQQNEFIKNAKVLDKDKALWADREGYFKGKLKDLTNRPDLENVTKDVATLGRGLVGDYKNFSDNMSRAASYQKELDDQVDKKIIDRETADNLLGMSMDTYGGMKYDPSSGKYSGTFAGMGAARTVDLNDWTKKVAGDIAASKHGNLIKSPEGDYFIKRGDSLERITKQQINSAIGSAMQNDPELHADLMQRSRIAGWQQGIKAPRVEDYPADQQAQIVEQAGRLGMKPNAYIKKMTTEKAGQQAYSDAVKNIYNLGYKYAYDKTEHSMEYDGETLDGKKKLLDIDKPAFMVTSPDDRFAEKEKDITKLQEGAAADTQSITDITAKINSGKYHPDEVNKLRQALISAKSNLVAKQSIMDGAREEVARNMNYDSYSDYLAKKNTIAAADQTYGKVMDGATGFNAVDANGKEVFLKKGAILKAMQEGEVKGNHTMRSALGSITVPGLGTFTVTNPQDVYKLEALNKHNEDFRQKVTENVKQNAERYAIKTLETPLVKTESEPLKQMILSNPSAFAFSDRSGGEQLSGSDLPKDFDLGSIKIIKDNGSTFLTASGLDDKGKPTGKSYNIKVTPGNNVGDVIGKRLLMANFNPKKPNEDRDSRAAGAILMGGNMSGTLAGLQNNEKLPISTSSGRLIGYVQRKGYRNNDGADSRFLVFGPDGKELDHPKVGLTQSMREDTGAMARWLEEELMKEESAEVGGKQ